MFKDFRISEAIKNILDPHKKEQSMLKILKVQVVILLMKQFLRNRKSNRNDELPKKFKNKTRKTIVQPKWHQYKHQQNQTKMKYTIT